MYHFNALISRMKYINRWGLMRCTRAENLAEHTAETAIIAHTLGLISCVIFKQDTDAQKLAITALYHDASEILTGDMPTPVKYANAELKNAYKLMEKQAQNKLCKFLPTELKEQMSPLLSCQLDEQHTALLKAADRLSALVKCIEEEQGGNKDFASAYTAQLTALKNMKLKEVDYFIENMLPSYRLSLDELAQI